MLHVDSWKTAERAVSYDLSPSARRRPHVKSGESAWVPRDLLLSPPPHCP